MRKQLFITLLTLLVMSHVIFASDSLALFRQITYNDLFETAKKENKAVMIYFHFDGCGACVRMERTTLRDTLTIHYLLSNYVCVEVNTLKGEGIEINKLYNVILHPTFLFLNSDAEELHKIVGYFGTNEFIRHASNALTTENSLVGQKESFSSGNRNSDFLRQHCYILRDANELDSTAINEYINTQLYQELSETHNIEFIYEFCMHRTKVCLPYSSPAFQFMLMNRELFYSHFDKDQVDTRLTWVLIRAINEAADENDFASFSNLALHLKDLDKGEQHFFKERDGRVTAVILIKDLVLWANMLYYGANGPDSVYQQLLDEQILKSWNDWESLNDIAWELFEQSEDPITLQKALKCAHRSVKLNSNYFNNDTTAWLLYKTGNFNDARKFAKRAIRKGERIRADYRDTTRLLELIQQGAGA